jgi:amino acid permease
LLGKPIEPVADGFLNNAVTFSKYIDLIALLSANRHENVFSWLLTIGSLTHLIEFFQSEIVKPTHSIGLPSRSAKTFSRPYE